MPRCSLREYYIEFLQLKMISHSTYQVLLLLMCTIITIITIQNSTPPRSLGP